MPDIKLKIESLFVKLGYWLYRNPFKPLAAILVFVIVFGFQTRNLTIDTSWEGMLRPHNPGRMIYNAFRDQFGQDRTIIIGIKTEALFTETFFEKLKSLHTDLENEVPYVEKVHSLINARNTRGEGDVLLVDELLQGWPEKKVDLISLKKYVQNNPFYRDYIVSSDAGMTALVIETQATVAKNSPAGDALLEGFDEDAPSANSEPGKTYYFSEKEIAEVIDAVNHVIDRYRSPDLYIALVGGPVIEDQFNRSTKKDMWFLIGLTTLMTIFFLALLFRRISGIILPYIVIYSSIICTMGIIAVSGVPLTIMTTVLPSFVMAVGIADSVHLLAVFFRRMQAGDSKENAIAFAMGHSGLAIVMTTLTTAAGLLSFSFAEMAAIADMGIFTAVGVLLALLFTVIMLPPLIALTPIKQKKTPAAEAKALLMDRLLLFCANFSTAHPIKILSISSILLIISVIGVFKIDFSHDMMKFFPDHFMIKPYLKFIDKNLNGIIPVEVIVDTKKENGIYDPEILNRIEQASTAVKEIKFAGVQVGKVFSINDILKETNQALHGNDPAFYTIPQDHDTIAQEFLLFENSGSDDLEKVVDSQFSKTRVTIKIHWVEIFTAEKFLREIKKQFNQTFAGRADITITGMAGLMGNTVPAALRSMAESYIIAGVVITIMMIMLVGSLKLGFLSMVPNLLPIVMAMALMAYLNIPLDFNGLMIGSIAIGLVVDDTMHFMYNFRKYYKQTGNAKKSIQETLLGAGRAMMITSLVLSSGFFITMLATLSNSVIFGFFTGLVILLALVADFILAPALMFVVSPDKAPAE